MIFFVLSISFRTVYRLNPDILGFATNIYIDKLVALTNEKRNQAGLNSLKLNPLLSQAAQAKATDMFTNNYWSHNSPQGKTPWDFINGSGYVYTVAGENLAKNFSDSSGVVEAWMNSPSHKDNLLRPQYEDIGFAIINGKLNGEETTLVVQMFGKSISQPVVAEATNQKFELIPPVETVQAESTDPGKIAVNTPKKNDQMPLGSNIIKNPLFDLGKISKTLVVVLSSVLMLVLVVDLIFVWKKKIVRVGGRNFAHIVFLLVINGIVWYMSFGSII